MPKTPPSNSEQILISPEDADLMDLFLIRRSLNPDGSMRYVQVIGTKTEIEAFAQNKEVILSQEGILAEQRTYSLFRLIMQRVLDRPLEPDELVTPKNGKNGDARRSNLELTNRSEIASRERGSWSNTGVKYVYKTELGSFYVNVNDSYLGTFPTVEQASDAVKLYFSMIEGGMSEQEAARRAKGRSRNADRIKIE